MTVRRSMMRMERNVSLAQMVPFPMRSMPCMALGFLVWKTSARISETFSASSELGNKSFEFMTLNSLVCGVDSHASLVGNHDQVKLIHEKSRYGQRLEQLAECTRPDASSDIETAGRRHVFGKEPPQAQ